MMISFRLLGGDDEGDDVSWEDTEAIELVLWRQVRSVRFEISGSSGG